MTRTLIAMAMIAACGRAAGPQTMLEAAAKAAGREISALSSVTCTETVVETKLTEKDGIEERRRRTFDYLVLVDTEDGDLAVTESRVEQGAPRSVETRPLLQSTGFATLMLILHPYYQNSFTFTDLGPVEEGGRKWQRLGFEFRPGAHSPSLLRAGAREYALAWKGEIRIDPASGRVGSVHASLGSQLEEIGLESLDATVRYGPGVAALDEWLPREAVVDLKTRHQHWRNVHTFANYKRFEVTTTEKQEAKHP